jgi:hypothetical protein
MLEGLENATAHRFEDTEIERSPTMNRRAPEPRRRELLARLTVMSRSEPGTRGEERVTTREAAVVARAWLDLIHSGRSASSWAVAAPAFREMMTPEEWQEALRCVRVTLGRCRSRRLRGQTAFDGFPGIPPGPYAVIHFESGFEERSRVVETVTTCRGPDGCWRATAYFVG